MLTLTYPIGIINLGSRNTVVETLTKVGFICNLIQVSPVKYNLVITAPADMNPEDILSLGSLIGSIQTEALM